MTLEYSESDILLVGVMMTSKKWKKHGFSTSVSPRFIYLNPEEVTAERLAILGVDVLLQKISDLLLPTETLERLSGEVEAWGGAVVDHDKDINVLSDRRRICDMLKTFTWSTDAPFLLPPTTECSAATGLAVPFIRKPVAACSVKDSHHMYLLFNRNDLPHETDHNYILQQFIPHHGVFYKVYVIGDAIEVRLRPSLMLDSLVQGDEVSSYDSLPLFFDSQKMKRTGPPLTCKVRQEALDRIEPLMPLIQTFTKALQKELHLTLFGWDLIIEEVTRTPYIIDVNYFPGYDEVNDFLPLIHRAISKKLHNNNRT